METILPALPNEISSKTENDIENIYQKDQLRKRSFIDTQLTDTESSPLRKIISSSNKSLDKKENIINVNGVPSPTSENEIDDSNVEPAEKVKPAVVDLFDTYTENDSFHLLLPPVSDNNNNNIDDNKVKSNNEIKDKNKLSVNSKITVPPGGNALLTPSTASSASSANPSTPTSSISSPSKNGFYNIVSDISRRFGRKITPTNGSIEKLNKPEEDTSNEQKGEQYNSSKERKKLSLSKKIAIASHNSKSTRSKLMLNLSGTDLHKLNDDEETEDGKKRQQNLRSILKNRLEEIKNNNDEFISTGTPIQESPLKPKISEMDEVALSESYKKFHYLTDLEDNNNSFDSQSEDSSNKSPNKEKKYIVFSESIEILPTFRKTEYNRKPDGSATFRRLTPQLKIQIREELNTFKRNEMPVHLESVSNTCFH